MTRRGSLAGSWLACMVLSFASCSGCREDYVAELVEKTNLVERDFARATNVWSTAGPGDRFRMGDALRTGHDGGAMLALAKRGRLLVKSDTVVRFMKSLDPTATNEEFEVTQGELTIETGELGRSIRTARGVVQLKEASTVRVRAEREKTRFEVEVGRVEYTLHGQRQVAAAGGSFDLEVLPVSVEAQPQPLAAGAEAEPAPAPAEPTEAASVGADPAARDERDARFQEPPPAAILTFAGGESVTIHDPAPPTDIGVTFGGCPADVVLELDRGNRRFDALRARGAGEVRARVARGTYKYRLRCLREGRLSGAAAASGKLTVVADAATRPLPVAAVTVTADADGRRYNVSYQNRLPKITLRWPYAPRANSYRLVVQPAEAAQFTMESKQPSVSLASGRLGEGQHQFRFETPDGKRSEQGVIQVSFDYTARTAYLTSPAERSSARDGRTRFAGGTLLGSKVQLQGVPLPLDPHGRFTGNLSIGKEQSGAAVRVQHPSTGIHYYVRHLTF